MRLDDLPMPDLTEEVKLPRLPEPITVRLLSQAERNAIAEALTPRAPAPGTLSEAQHAEADTRMALERQVVAVAVAMNYQTARGAWTMDCFGRAAPVVIGADPKAKPEVDQRAAAAEMRRRDFAAAAVEELSGGPDGIGRLTAGELFTLHAAVNRLEGLDFTEDAAKNSSSPSPVAAEGVDGDLQSATPTPSG